jgi:hypothetical protein
MESAFVLPSENNSLQQGKDISPKLRSMLDGNALPQGEHLIQEFRAQSVHEVSEATSTFVFFIVVFTNREIRLKNFYCTRTNIYTDGKQNPFSVNFPHIQSTMTSEMHHSSPVANPPFAHLAYNGVKFPYHMAGLMNSTYSFKISSHFQVNAPYMNAMTSGHFVPVPKMFYGNQNFAAYPMESGIPISTIESLKPRVFYRNLFHVMHGKFAADAATWEGCRVYISDNVGYSGNAKRFKKRAEIGTFNNQNVMSNVVSGEKALILDCVLLDPKEQPITQACLACRDYFETQKYFKTNQEWYTKKFIVK